MKLSLVFNKRQFRRRTYERAIFQPLSFTSFFFFSYLRNKRSFKEIPRFPIRERFHFISPFCSTWLLSPTGSASANFICHHFATQWQSLRNESERNKQLTPSDIIDKLSRNYNFTFEPNAWPRASFTSSENNRSLDHNIVLKWAM